MSSGPAPFILPEEVLSPHADEIEAHLHFTGQRTALGDVESELAAAARYYLLFKGAAELLTRWGWTLSELERAYNGAFWAHRYAAAKRRLGSPDAGAEQWAFQELERLGNIPGVDWDIVAVIVQAAEARESTA